MSELEKLEQAIAHIEAQRDTLGDAVVEASAAVLRERLAALRSAQAPGQQRKIVTVLFAEISGLAPTDASSDSEESTLLLNELWNRLDLVIVEHGGRIDKHMGNGVMAVWGVIAAREDDPERAINAALALQSEIQACADSWPTVPLQLKVGINTGLALLGEVGITGEYTAIGDTVNLAKRLEEIAPQSGILISHDTFRHIRGVFDLVALDPVTVKGKAEPVQTYLVERAKPRAFRKATRGVEGVETRMIGREDDMTYLQEAYIKAAAGQRQAVTVVGDAGVGKSRLLYEFEDWLDLRPEQIRFFRGRANPESQGHPYALLRDVFSFRFEIQDSDSPETVCEKLEQGVHNLLGAQEAAPAYAQMRAHFIGQMLGFDLSDSPYLYSVLGDARQIYDRARIYLREVLETAAMAMPLVLFLEDVHWSDDSSLNVIEYLARILAQHRVLIVCLTRPTLLERRPAWGFQLLQLQPLSREDSCTLVAEILQKVDQVPETLRELIVSGAEGNPFYVEELIKMLIEDNVIVTAGAQWHIEPALLTAVRVPPTLAGVLQARLDSLPSAERVVLQQASVVGRVFWEQAVAYLGRHAESSPVPQPAPEDVAATLVTLRSKEMVFPRASSAFFDTQEYIFKHSILREVTYESVLRRVRRVYHGLVADWLIAQGGSRAQEHTGLIADHLELAGDAEHAIRYLRQAGEQAAQQFAHAEALNYFGRAIDLLPETAYGERYALLLARARVYDVQGNREAQAQDLATGQALLDHLEGEAADIAQRRTELALEHANLALVTSDFPGGIAAAREAVAMAQEAKQTDDEEALREARRLQSAAHWQWAQGLWRIGDFEGCRAQLEKALALAQAAGSRQLEADSLRIMGNVHYYLGDYGPGQEYYQQGLLISREIGDRRAEGSALSNLGEAARSQGDYATARSYYEQRLEISREIGDRLSENIALANLGLVAHNLDDNEAARDYCQKMLRIAREIGNRSHEGYALNNLGHALAGLDLLEEAAEAYRQAAALRHELGEHFLAMESTAGLARTRLATGDVAGAMEQVEAILSYLEANTLDGTDEPLRVYQACYEVLVAADDPRAGPVLKTAHRLLLERANRIRDPQLRRSFLEDVGAHRAIVQAAGGE